MSEIVERVARAMHAKHFEFAVPDDGGHPGLFYFREMAKTAIEAMREPTEAMLDGTNYPNTTWDSGDADVWRAMIDAALKD
jgi:hypothetical protein